MGRDVIHETQDGDVTLCTQVVEVDWTILSSLDGFPTKNSVVCQPCKREVERRNAPVHVSKKRTRVYLGHVIEE
jgi:hypothetical protein